jgi:hypothetical protein
LLVSTYIAFYIFWGFNYFRNDFYSRLDIQTAEISEKDLTDVFSSIIEQANQNYCVFDTLSKNTIHAEVEQSYRELQNVLQIKYPAGRRPDKGITFSRFFAQSGISGYFGPFFNEVHVNKKVLRLEYPFTLAHEKAHQLGITSEAEANFYAWLVCSQSHHKHLRYSANIKILRHFMFQAYGLEGFSELVKTIDDNVLDDIRRVNQHWATLRNDKMDRTATKINDIYLKSNHVQQGVKDYHGVVKHIINFSLDSNFQQKHNLANN